ncbi:hypothetical protein EO087_02570 [Dyella sp. M7H15-1]|uniref:3-deoxy-7-phosphoheptulonate synthase n=1 Tax=Dyella sp. M7H15-1 TaxID=2501295 RepID=UPI001004E2DF|nr:3-deoxy-7-phosphoheptulonate synthase [Dyella sp. M7H15-1]QAU23010.1 hypothetical protein EO087_02570 [Dyella sp. M7H15-1]
MSRHESQLDRWTPREWRDAPLRHMPQPPQEECPLGVTARLSRMPGLVDAEEVKELRSALRAAAKGQTFVLQLGNPDRHLEDAGDADVSEYLRSLESMQQYLALMLRMPVLSMGLVAGVDAAADGTTIAAYYEAMLAALESMRRHRFHPYISHDAANLHAEEALVRNAGMLDGFYASSTHLLWLEGVPLPALSSQLEFLCGLLNPIGMRVSAHSSPEDLLGIYRQLNPSRETGKIVLVSSLGEDLGRLRHFIGAFRDAAAPVVWMCDPCWAHTAHASNDAGALMQAVTAEVEHTALLHADEGSVLAGLRLEIAHELPVAGRRRLDFQQALRVCSELAGAWGGER